MVYIDLTPNSSGAYANPKGQPFKDCIELNDEQAKLFFKYNGFIKVTSIDPLTIEPNTDAWEEWKQTEAEKEEQNKATSTTEDDLMLMAIDHEYRLTLLELGVI